MQFPTNPFKQALKEGRPQIGLWAAVGDAYATEAIAGTGFDWLLIDAEHGPNDLRGILAQSRAAAPYPVHSIVRPPTGDVVLIKQLLELGTQTLLIPMIESAEQAATMVAAVRYPPQGVRGVSVSQRGNRYGAVPDYFARVNEQIAVVVQIESRAGAAAAAEIAAVDGVDGLFIGPSDLAAGFGHLGNPGHPEVQQAIAQVHAAAQAVGKATGILSPAEADARRYLEMGMRFVAVGSDLGVLRMQTQALADRYRHPQAGPIAAQY